MDFRELNKSCPKDNFPTPFIDHIIDESVGSKVLYFMDIFSGYNQIQIKPEDQHKTISFFLGVHLCTGRFLSGLKTSEIIFNVL
jgi:hypothetical protein